MKQIEQIQMEQSKQPSKINIAMQGENVNPMALSSQAIGEHGCTRRDSSDEVAISWTPTQSSLQPQFLQATPGQQFGFRVPDATSQAESDTWAPPRVRFLGIITDRGNPPRSRSGYHSGPGGGMVSNTRAVPAPIVQVVQVVQQHQRTSVLG